MASREFACPACGQANRENASFCRDCGIELAATAQPVATPIVTSKPLSNAPRVPDRPVPDRPSRDVPRRRSGPGGGRDRRGTAIGVPVALLGIAALIGWLTGWPPQLFASTTANVTAPVTTVPAAQQSATGSPSAATGSPSAATGSPSAATGSPSATAPTGPAAVVQDYFAAITDHDYAQAWNLGGKNFGGSYSNFVAGLDTTAQDTLTIVSVSGDQVTAQLAADQTDGTVKDFSGVYTVSNGTIVQAQVQQTN